MSLLGVCLVWAAVATSPAGPVPSSVFVPVQAFTLAWTHSIEKVRWEEDYAVRQPAGARAPFLHAVAARVRGSAAGMEPPADAVLRDGWYHYTPTQKNPSLLNLSRSEFVPDYELCAHGQCHPLSHWLPSDGGVTRLSACQRGGPP